VGEVAFLPRSGPAVLGRGEARPDDPGPRLLFGQARPGRFEGRGPLASASLSRRQLVLRGAEGQVEVTQSGRGALLLNGAPWEGGTVAAGDVISVEGELVLLVQSHADEAPPERPAVFPFGEADGFGLVGESPRAWQLRRELSFYAARPGHVLLTGPSGAGKELCARALHGLSPRARGAFVARSAATLPSGIIDAELFGNERHFPNPGMRERQGLVGAADGGTLFLDEIGEIPEELQAHLLRLLDGGDYHRLGEEQPRRADLRFLGATNREEDSLKHDLLARLTLRVGVPGLDERREDIPLIARALLRRVASADPAVAARFFDGAEARLDPALVDALLRHSFQTHVRELEFLLMLAMASSRDRFIALGPEVEARLRLPRPRREPPTRDEIEAALKQANYSMSRAWVDLGLSSRDALYRLIKKHNIPTRKG